jgi:DCN1-like protein 1/2
MELNLGNLFDTLRGSLLCLKLSPITYNVADATNDEKDKLELESTMKYIKDILKVKLDDAGLFVVQELVQAPSIGEITRQGYIDGWKKSR